MEYCKFSICACHPHMYMQWSTEQTCVRMIPEHFFSNRSPSPSLTFRVGYRKLSVRTSLQLWRKMSSDGSLENCLTTRMSLTRLSTVSTCKVCLPLCMYVYICRYRLLLIEEIQYIICIELYVCMYMNVSVCLPAMYICFPLCCLRFVLTRIIRLTNAVTVVRTDVITESTLTIVSVSRNGPEKNGS